MRITAETKDREAILKILRACGLTKGQIGGLLRATGRKPKTVRPKAKAVRSVKGADRGSKLVSDDA